MVCYTELMDEDKTVVLTGKVPVYVEVSLSGEVTRVVADDSAFAWDYEALNMMDIRAVSDDGSLTAEDRKKAFEIADNAMWPGWDWGF